MCGIFGYYTFEENSIPKAVLQNMGSSIRHRGPDHLGIYQDSCIGAGNARLSIIDLKQGNQPMFSEDKNIVLVQNGEIYNYKELKKSLASIGIEFSTQSDTEVLLKGIQHHGLDFLKELNGMFSIAVYNKQSKKMYLIRDRLGVKPLYYYRDNKIIAFSSEIKALFKLNIKKDLDKDNIAHYLKLGYLPKEKTLFKNISQLLPGSYLEIGPQEIKEHKWWELSASTKSVNVKNYQEILHSTLRDSVNIRTRSDVPFGGFLSGGLDSAMVLNYASSAINKNAGAFTISFKGTKFDELEKAKKVAKELDLKHHIVDFKKNDLKLWPFFIQQTDLPHSDISFLPTYHLSKLASEKVKMVLSGDGADEFWGGYNRHIEFYKEYERNKSISAYSSFLKNNFIFNGTEIDKLLSVPSDDTLEKDIQDTVNTVKNSMDPINQILYLDCRYLLPGNNLIKIDRMGMACSLEIRSPFMDYRLADLAFQSTGETKFKPYGVKSHLKNIASSSLNNEIIAQEKQMFTVPISEWEGDSLGRIMGELQFKDRGIFNMDYIEEMKSSYKKEKKIYLRKLRTLVSLELWFNLTFDSTSCESLMDICSAET